MAPSEYADDRSGIEIPHVVRTQLSGRHAESPTSMREEPSQPPPQATFPPTQDIPHVVIPRSHSPRTPYGDIADADAQRERLARLDDAENRLQDALEVARAAEDQREAEFRRNESERRERFEENERMREQQAQQARDVLLHEGAVHEGAVPHPESLPASEEEVPEEVPITEVPEGVGIKTPSSAPSIRTAGPRPQSGAVTESILTFVREELARERDAAQSARVAEEVERDRVTDMQEARIRELEAELAEVRGQLESERQQRRAEEEERAERTRIEFVERDEALRNQLTDITNLINQQREECQEKRTIMDERYQEKLDRRQEKESRYIDLRETFQRLHDEVIADRARMEEERVRAEARPGMITSRLPSLSH
jgi:hypothetical protein